MHWLLARTPTVLLRTAGLAVLFTHAVWAEDGADFVKRRTLALSAEPSRPGSPGQRWLSSLAWSPDGKTVAVAGQRTEGWGRCSGEVKLWNVETGEMELYLQKLPTRTHTVAFSPDGKTFAVGDGDYYNAGVVTLFERRSGRETVTLGNPKGDPRWVYGLVFSPDGKTLIQSSSSYMTTARIGQDWGDGEVREWTLSSGQSRVLSSRHADWYRELAISPDGSMIAVAAGHNFLGPVDVGEVRVCNVASGEERFALGGHRTFVETVAFSPDGKMLASGGMDGVVWLRDVSNGRKIDSINPPAKAKRDRGRILSVVFSPDGKTLAVCVGDYSRGNKFGQVQLWDVPTRTVRQVLDQAGELPSCCVRFSPDGSSLAVIDENQKAIDIWGVK
jgi:eukaryotic-like serine/threonine-protein kinase